MFKEEELVKELKAISTGKEFNALQKKLREEKISWDRLQIATKQEFVNAMERIHPCPKEYKENPNIHYEVAHKKTS